MPSSAYALLALFAAVSAGSGWLAARILGPRRPWAVIVPSLAAFGALYLVGHRTAIRVGPEVQLFGWQISLAFDVVVAAATALLASAAQRLGLRLLQPDQGRARGDGLT